MAKSVSVKFDKLHVMLFVLVFGVLGLAALAISSAAPAAVTGTLQLQTSDETLNYGDTISYTGSVSGKQAPNSSVYITTVCSQNGKIVFQYSASFSNPIVLTDQTGDNLDWQGGAASCEAWLIYRVQKGKGFQYNTLDIVKFDVAA